MIDENLLNKFNQIEDLPVSEEMLGAYMEGKYSSDSSETTIIEDAMSQYAEFASFARELSDIESINEVLLNNEAESSAVFIENSDMRTIDQFLNTYSKENFDRSDIISQRMDSITIDEPRKESHQSNESTQNIIIGKMADKIEFGYEANHTGDTFDPNIYQGTTPSCAIRSQEIIMRDYGIVIPQEELIQYATENGWYIPDGAEKGTPRDATGNILDAVGITTQRFDNASIYDIIAELRAGHRVIVSVDANELWVKNEPNLFKRLFVELNNKVNDKLDELTGVQGANHALIVAGVNVNPDNPSDMRVVLIDSGSGDVCIEYSFKDFKKAWDDSNHHMVTTTEPAPFQYNYITHEMEPSNFQSDFMPSMVNLPAGLHNQFELPDTYFDKYGNLEPEYSWNHVVPFLEKWDEENHAQREHLVASSTNSSHEEDDSHTSDELSEGNYTSYENDDDSVDSSSEEDTSSHSYNDEDDTYEPESDQMDNGNPSDFDDESDF